jgi:hypothetical protein
LTEFPNWFKKITFVNCSNNPATKNDNDPIDIFLQSVFKC